MRDKIFIHPGNPINLEKMKRQPFKTSLRWPVRIADLDDTDAQTTRRYLFTSVAFPVIHLGIMYMYVQTPELVEFRIPLLVFIVMFLIVGTQKDIPILKLLLPPIGFAAFVPTFSVPLEFIPWECLLAAFELMHISRVMVRHYSSVTIEAGPSSITKPKRFVFTTALVASFLDALHSFLTYGSGGVYAPGMQPSAVGGITKRVGHLVFVYLLVFHACLVVAINLFPVDSTAVDFADVIAIVTVILAAHIVPVAIVFAVPFFLTLAHLPRLYAAKQADLAPERFAECFPDLISTLCEECGVHDEQDN